MNEYRRLCFERARELARKPYPLTAAQIAERTGVSRGTACTIISRERRERERRERERRAAEVAAPR